MYINLLNKSNELEEYDNENNSTVLEDNGIDWFDIEYTSELAQISKNSEITNILNFVKTMTSVVSIAPPEKQQEVINKIDFNKIAERKSSKNI